MLIVIEGIDRTGKSTLATSLAVATGGDIIHAAKPTKHPIDEYVGPLINYDPTDTSDDNTLILDRWHIGELVWPGFFGRSSALDDAVFRWIEMFMKSRGAVYVWADRTDTDAWIEELVAADEPVKTVQDILRLTDDFQMAFDASQGADIMRFDLAHSTLAKQTADILTRTPQVIGANGECDVLLVGDIAAIERQGKLAVRSDSPLLPFAPYPR